MKKFLAFLLLFLLLLPCTVSGTSETAVPDTADVNGDSRLSLADALLCIRSMLNSNFTIIPDLNQDGRGSLADVIHILRECAKIDGAFAFAPLTGSGTETDPYKIRSAADLAFLSEQVRAYEDTEGLYFAQIADILLTAANWTPIGTTGIPFAGHYDGGGYKVEGLSIETSESFQGLFGFITGTVKDLSVYGKISVHYTGTHSHSFVGGIVGAMNNGAVVKGCKSYVSVEGDSYVGGVVGAIVYTDDYLTDAFSVIEDCSFHGTLTADDRSAINEDAMYFGGIAGRAYGAIKNCVNYGNIHVTGEKTGYVGGITGYAYSLYKAYSPSAEKIPALTLENCENKGDVSGGTYIGGIVAQTSLPVKNCVNNGAVSGAKYVGGIVGVNGTSATYAEGYTLLSECTNNGTVTVSDISGGGIAGYSYSPILSCENAGKVLGTADATRIGGIVGYCRSNVTSCNNLTSAKVTGLQGIGGIIGYFNQASATVTECNNYAPVTVLAATEEAYHIGGIVGMLGSTNTVLHCQNDGAVTGGGGTHAAGTGGIVGSLHSGSVIESCINRGTITGNMRVGGIAGHGKMSKASYIRTCTNEGSISATAASGAAYLGGILGSGTSGNVVDCTNRGKVQTDGATDCFSATVGSASGTTTVTNVKSEV